MVMKAVTLEDYIVLGLLIVAGGTVGYLIGWVQGWNAYKELDKKFRERTELRP